MFLIHMGSQKLFVCYKNIGKRNIYIFLEVSGIGYMKILFSKGQFSVENIGNFEFK